MDGYVNMAELVPCPHCGAEMRRGMVRCRECGKSSKEDAGGDFELSGHVLVASQDPKCPRCGSVLDPAVADCPVCTSQMLDQLMSAAVPAPHMAAERPMSIMEQRVRQAAALAAVQERETAAEFETVAENSTSRLRPDPPVKAKGATVTQPSMNPARSPVNKGAARGERPAAEPKAPVAAPAKTTTPEEEEPPTPAVETSPACAALLASLAAADANLRCEIATALGKLGDKAALEPLERHMGDKDIRVRRAVATALVQLGHPKGETLLDIAERMPASSVLQLAKPPAKLKKKSGGGGMNLDPKMLMKVGGGALAAAILGGGIWMWMNSTPSRPKKKGKAGTTQKAPEIKKGKAKAKAK